MIETEREKYMGFCTKCGAIRDKEKDTCPLCGEKYEIVKQQAETQNSETQQIDQLHDSADTTEQDALTQETVPPTVEENPSPVAEEIPPATRKQEPTATKSPKPKRPSVLIPLLIFLVAGMIIGGVIFSQLNRTLAVGRAVSNFGDEVMERINASPLTALALLMESTNGGELRGEFTANTYDDENDELLSTLSAVFSIISGANNSATAINASVSEDDDNFDISIFLNQEGAAFSSGMLDSDSFYGIEFDTLRRDFLAFADVVGLSWNESNRIIAQLENFQPNTITFDFAPYTNLFRDTLLAAEQRAERVNLNIDGENISVRRIDYVFDLEDLANLLRDLHGILRRDNGLREIFDTSYNNILRQLNWMIDDIDLSIENGADFDFVLSFYIGSRNRLMRVNLDVVLEENRTTDWTTITLDLGRTIYCPWVFSVDSDYMRASVEWNFSTDDGTENSIVIIGYENHWLHGWTRNTHIEAAITWDDDREDFTIAFENQAIRLEREFSGSFALTNNGFAFAFEHDGFSLEIKLDTSVEMPDFPENFVNISEWDQDFVDNADYVFRPWLGFLLDALFGNWSDDWDDDWWWDWDDNDDWWDLNDVWDWNDNDDWNDDWVPSGLNNDRIRGYWVIDVQRTIDNTRVDVEQLLGPNWYQEASLYFDGPSGQRSGFVEWNVAGFEYSGNYEMDSIFIWSASTSTSQFFWDIMLGATYDTLILYIDDLHLAEDFEIIYFYWRRPNESSPPNNQPPPDNQPPQEEQPPILPPETPESLEEYVEVLNAWFSEINNNELSMSAFAYNNYLGYALTISWIDSSQAAEWYLESFEFEDDDWREEMLALPFTMNGIIYQILSPTGEILAYRVFR